MSMIYFHFNLCLHCHFLSCVSFLWHSLNPYLSYSCANLLSRRIALKVMPWMKHHWLYICYNPICVCVNVYAIESFISISSAYRHHCFFRSLLYIPSVQWIDIDNKRRYIKWIEKQLYLMFMTFDFQHFQSVGDLFWKVFRCVCVHA